MCSEKNSLEVKLLKTCGIRKKLENYNNIDLLGFNFIESSKRYINPEKANKINTPFSTLRVGVFGIQNSDKSWKNIKKNELVDIILTAKKSRMNAIQIYGTCDFAYLKLYNYLVISSVTLFSPNLISPKGREIAQNIDFYIIDGANPGSGELYNYSEINKLNLEKNFLVAGGINEKNVGEVFEIFKNNKYFCGVDIASGVDNGENICLDKVERVVEEIQK